MSNRNRFAFIRNRFGSGIVRLPQALSTATIPPVTHTIDLLELKEPVVVGEPTPGKKIGIKAPSLENSYELCLPVDDGDLGEVLTTDGTGILSWAAAAGGTDNSSSTGVLSGGILSLNADPTKFDVSDGNGIVFNTATLTATEVSWTGLTGQSGVYVGDQSFISINSSGVPVFNPTVLTNSEIRDNIFLGQLIHLDQVNLDAALNEQMTLLSTNNQVRDLMKAIGELNVSGNVVSSNTLLTVAKSEGVIISFGANFINDINNPHFPTVIAIDTNLGPAAPNSFAYRYQDGTQGANVVDVIPAEFDDGNGQGTPGVVGANKWTVQRVFTFSIGGLIIQPGQFVYNSEAEAIAAINTEGFVLESSVIETGVLIAFISMQGNATDLSDTATANFMQATKFGSGAAGSAGGILGTGVSTDDAVVRWNGVSGNSVQNSAVIITDSAEITGVSDLTLNADGSLVFTETAAGGGTNTATIQCPALGSNYTLTLPVDDGNASEFLQTDGVGVLSWAAAGGGGGGFVSGHLSGCKLVHDTGTLLEVTAGSAKDGTDTEDITIGSLSIDIDNTGALGLMTGESKVSNTTYEVYLMHDDTIVNADSAFFVTEGVTPAESGYTHFRYIGAIRNGNGGIFLNFYMGGNGRFRKVMYYDSFSNLQVLSSGSATTFTTMSFGGDTTGDLCPTGSTMVLLNVNFESDVTTNASIRFRPEGDSGDHIDCFVVQSGGSQTTGSQFFTQLWVPLPTSRDVQYEGSSSSLDNAVSVIGYEIEL